MSKKIIIFLIIICAAAFMTIPVACVNTKSPDVKVVFFLQMIKSGNFNDAQNYIDKVPFAKNISQKVINLPAEAIVAIIKTSPVSKGIDVSTTDETKINELRKVLADNLQKTPEFIIDLTLKELSANLQDKDFDLVSQNIGEETGEVFIKLSSADKHEENIVFAITKINGEWVISQMNEVIKGWFF